MKKLLFLLLLLPLTSFYTTNDVYICKSENAKKYHLVKDCRGLNSCKAEIGKVTLAEAKKQGKTICLWEN